MGETLSNGFQWPGVETNARMRMTRYHVLVCVTQVNGTRSMRYV